MKTSITVFSLFVTITLLIVQSYYQKGFTNVSGAPAGRAGSPFDFGGLACNASGCHTSFPLGSRPGWITSNIPGAGYIPGQTYTITATASSPNRVRFGFEISPQTSTGANAGTMILTNTLQTRFATAAAPNNTRWITHTLTGSSASPAGSKMWSFDWTAPSIGVGTVTFYGAFNCANNSSSSLGDSIFLSQLVVPENPTGTWEETGGIFSFNVYPVPAGENLFIRLKAHDNFLAQMELTDISGKIIRKVSDAGLTSGQEYIFNIYTGDIDSGIYFIRMIHGSVVSVKKIMVL